MATAENTSPTGEMLKQMASESVKQGENLRGQVRDMTLQALKTRELTVEQIKQVVRSVSQGVNLGAAIPAIDVGKTLTDAIHGMDDALLKAVQANRLALEQFSSQSSEFSKSYLHQALEQLKRVEYEFFGVLKQTAEASTGKLREQWSEVLKHTRIAGTDSGREVADTVEAFQNQMTTTMRESQAATVKAFETFNNNFLTMASGILIGLSEALEAKRGEKKGG